MGIVSFMTPRQGPALGLVRLSDNFAEQTGRMCGLEGVLRGYDAVNRDIAVVDIGEKFPVRVHRIDMMLLA